MTLSSRENTRLILIAALPESWGSHSITGMSGAWRAGMLVGRHGR